LTALQALVLCCRSDAYKIWRISHSTFV